ncbi:hypothetical protein [Leptolyngbya sp. FACHB-16]|uniref:hypothetical protein n=1 Tax=unclassified Leptolyngbya TaxID=2650499 RepID=UPI001686C508|nr:hypothetical protein [Leptolyngbya sp. FACHB-16]MBD2156212.1 hypothetical protein [Leptolyngbya sp. FACHB-16]
MLTPQDWITLAHTKWTRFKAIAPVARTSLMKWTEEDKRLLIDCASDMDVEVINDHISEVSWLAWLVLGCEELGVYSRDSTLFEGDTRRIPPIESGEIPDLLGEVEAMVATLDRGQVEELAVKEFQATLDEQIDSIADEAVQKYLSSSEFQNYVSQRLAQKWRSPSSTNGTSATATIEAPTTPTEAPAAEPAAETPATTPSFEISRSYSITLWNAIQAIIPDSSTRLDMLTKIRGKRKEGKEFLNQVTAAYPEEKRAKAWTELTKPQTLDAVKAKLQPNATKAAPPKAKGTPSKRAK